MKICRFFALFFGLVAPITLGEVFAQAQSTETHEVTFPTSSAEYDLDYIIYEGSTYYPNSESYGLTHSLFAYVMEFTRYNLLTPDGFLSDEGLEECREAAETCISRFNAYLETCDLSDVDLEGAFSAPVLVPYYYHYDRSNPGGYYVLFFVSKSPYSMRLNNFIKGFISDFFYDCGINNLWWHIGDMMYGTYCPNEVTGFGATLSSVYTSSIATGDLDGSATTKYGEALSATSSLPFNVSYTPSVASAVESGGNLASNTPEVATTSNISVQDGGTGTATIVINQDTTVNYDFELGDAPDEMGYDDVEVNEVEVKDNEEKEKYTLKYFYETGDGIRLNQQKLWDEVDQKFGELFPREKIEEFLEALESGGSSIEPIECSFMIPPFAQTWSFTVDLESYASMSVIQIIRGMAGFFVSLETLLMCVRLMA